MVRTVLMMYVTLVPTILAGIFNEEAPAPAIPQLGYTPPVQPVPETPRPQLEMPAASKPMGTRDCRETGEGVAEVGVGGPVLQKDLRTPAGKALISVSSNGGRQI